MRRERIWTLSRARYGEKTRGWGCVDDCGTRKGEKNGRGRKDYGARGGGGERLTTTTTTTHDARRRGGKAGYVYMLGLRNGKANVDEYSPIWVPQDFKSDGDKYEGNLVYWAATLAGIIGTGALAIYLTSAL